MLRFLYTGLTFFFLTNCSGSRKEQPDKEKPNFIVILTDDQGYADAGCYGARGFSTPNLDRMAEEGILFTDFHATTGVCSASRAALLTGCYHNRIGINGALPPGAKTGIGNSEKTIAEIVKEQGYTTSIIGKWHLGDSPNFNPLNHGFDEFFGLPYSNDMWPKNKLSKHPHPPLPLMDGEKVIAYIEDQSYLTTWYTERAINFIRKNAGKPFFLYLAHSMPHVPLYVSDKFRGKSGQGLYGDVIMEIDWSVGEILKELKEQGIDRNTLVIFTSDNGPWLSYGNHAGSAYPLREGKGTIFEGGIRVPAIMWWPGAIPPGTVCGELATTMDVLPTLTKLSGGKLPLHKTDGHDIWPLMVNEKGAKSPTGVFYCYYQGELRAIRSGKWKLHFPHYYRKTEGMPTGHGGIRAEAARGEIGMSLFDLENDAGERINMADQCPEVVKHLEALAEKGREDLGDKLTSSIGQGIRGPGRIE